LECVLRRRSVLVAGTWSVFCGGAVCQWPALGVCSAAAQCASGRHLECVLRRRSVLVAGTWSVFCGGAVCRWPAGGVCSAAAQCAGAGSWSVFCGGAVCRRPTVGVCSAAAQCAGGRLVAYLQLRSEAGPFVFPGSVAHWSRRALSVCLSVCLILVHVSGAFISDLKRLGTGLWCRSRDCLR